MRYKVVTIRVFMLHASKDVTCLFCFSVRVCSSCYILLSNMDLAGHEKCDTRRVTCTEMGFCRSGSVHPGGSEFHVKKMGVFVGNSEKNP